MALRATEARRGVGKGMERDLGRRGLVQVLRDEIVTLVSLRALSGYGQEAPPIARIEGEDEGDRH